MRILENGHFSVAIILCHISDSLSPTKVVYFHVHCGIRLFLALPRMSKIGCVTMTPSTSLSLLTLCQHSSHLPSHMTELLLSSFCSPIIPFLPPVIFMVMSLIFLVSNFFAVHHE